MLVEILIGCLFGVIMFDRFDIIVAIFPALFDFLYHFIFPKIKPVKIEHVEFPEPEIIESEKHIEIPSCIDEALTKLLETIHDNYLEYINNSLNLSRDFNKRIRQIIQHFFSDLCHRISKIDAKALVLNIFIPKTAYHLRQCNKASKIFQLDEPDIVRKVYPLDRIHCGVMFMDSDEDMYLKNLFESILHLSLPENQRNSRIMLFLLRSVLAFNVFKPLVNYLSDPTNIRSIIISVLNQESETYESDEPCIKIPILRDFTSPQSLKWRQVLSPPNELRVTWSQLQSNPSLMYVFLQVFKKNNRFIFPHFCVAYDEWTTKISKLETLSNSLKDDQIHSLIIEAREIFKVFVCPESFHRIKFNREIVSKVAEIDFKNETEENLVKIRCLYGILHNLAFKVLTAECLDYFYHSPPFFMLCFGERPKIRDKLSAYHITRSRKVLGISKKNSDTKSRENDVKFAKLDVDSDAQSDYENLSDSLSIDTTIDRTQNIDLSNVKVHITDVKCIARKNERNNYFIISVTKTEPGSDETQTNVVQRAYKEFYALENRLKRFHGARLKNVLHPKRSFLMEKSPEYLRHCIKPFQEYIDSLLENEYLRYSSMLNTFLTDDEVITPSSFLSRTSMVTGRAIQSVIDTLSTQKGKFIDGFMNNFAQSTEAQKPKIHYKNSFSKLKKKFSIFKNQYYPNSSISKMKYQKPIAINRNLVHEIIITIIEIVNPTNFYNTLIHVLYAIFGAFSELFFKRWISEKIDNMTHPMSIAKMIYSLNSLVISNSSSSQSFNSKNEKISLNKQKDDHIETENPNQSWKINIDKSLNPFMKLLEYSDLNKQLIYNYLDDIFAAIYPELIQAKPLSSNEIPLEEY